MRFDSTGMRDRFRADRLSS